MIFKRYRKIYVLIFAFFLLISPFIGRHVRSKAVNQSLSNNQIDSLVNSMKANAQLKDYFDNFERVHVKGGYIDKSSYKVIFPAVIEESNDIKHDVLITLEKEDSRFSKPVVLVYGVYPIKFQKIVLSGFSEEPDTN